MSGSGFLDDSPQFVTITSVHRLSNALAGDVTWPIIQPQTYLGPASFWNITQVSGTTDQFLLQDNDQNRYLTPGGERNSTLLKKQVFPWKIVPAGAGDVNLFKISEPGKNNFLQSGYRFADPANAYAMVSEAPSADPTTSLWIIEKART